MRKDMRKREPKPDSIPYYIEEVVRYRSEKETSDNFKDGYPPVVPELLLSILISVRTIRHALCFLSGALGYIALKLLLQL